MNPANTNRMCKFEFVRPTAASNINMPTAILIKPMACIRIRPNRGNHQDAKQETDQQNRSITAPPSARAKSRAPSPRGRPEISIAPKIVGVNNPTPYVAISIRNQGDRYQRRACAIRTRKEDRRPTGYVRNWSCELLVITGKPQRRLSLLGNDPNESFCRDCTFTARPSTNADFLVPTGVKQKKSKATAPSVARNNRQA